MRAHGGLAAAEQPGDVGDRLVDPQEVQDPGLGRGERDRVELFGRLGQREREPLRPLDEEGRVLGSSGTGDDTPQEIGGDVLAAEVDGRFSQSNLGEDRALGHDDLHLRQLGHRCIEGLAGLVELADLRPTQCQHCVEPDGHRVGEFR